MATICHGECKTFKPKKTVLTVKHWIGSITLVSHQILALHKIDEITKRGTISKCLIVTSATAYSDTLVFQHDNDPKNTSKQVTSQHYRERFECLKTDIFVRKPISLCKQYQLCQEEQSNIQEDFSKNTLVVSKTMWLYIACVIIPNTSWV